MATALVFLAIIMSAIIWWLARQTVNVRPWEPDHPDRSSSDNAQSVPTYRGEPGSFNFPSIKLGLGLFLCVATSLFGLMISAYFVRVSMPDWVQVSPPMLMWLNTAVLIASAVIVHRTRIAVHADDSRWVRIGLLTGGILTLIFVAGQLLAWEDLAAAEQGRTTSPASSFFYLFTGIHAVHVLGGLWVWARASIGAFFGLDSQKLTLRVELCAVYWNYLLVVWLLLFATLQAT